MTPSAEPQRTGCRLIHLVADYGAGDLAFAEVVQRLALALPDTVVHPVVVAPYDTLAAGFCVAQLLLNDGPSDRIVVHDVTAGGDEAGPGGEGPRFCVGRTRAGVLAVGPNAGWSWSFAVDELRGLCYLDVPADGSHFRSRDRLPVAIAHVVAGHPHAICGTVPSARVPPVPEGVIAYVDGYGDLETTLSRPPAASGDRVVVSIGGVSATAIVADSPVAVAEGELALAPGSSGWPTGDGAHRRFLELSLRGGSAARRFADPATGTPVALTPAGAVQPAR